MATSTTHKLFDLVVKCMTELGTLRTGTATSGATNTIIDTNGLKKVDDGYYDDGTAFIMYDAGGSGAAPQGEMSVITSFAKASSTLTVQNAFSVAVVSGDKYGVANRRFPLDRIVEKINMRLFSDIYIPQTDTSLTTVADQSEYTLPSAAAVDLRDVLIAQNTDSANYDYISWSNWTIKPADVGGTHKLVFDTTFDAGYQILLVYGGRHPDLRIASDQLSEFVHPDIVVYGACYDALQEYRDRTRLTTYDRKIEDLFQKATAALEAHPLPPIPLRKAKIMRVSNNAATRLDNISRYGGV